MKKYIQLFALLILGAFVAVYSACKKESAEEKTNAYPRREISVLDASGKYSFTFQIESDCEELLNSIAEQSIAVYLTGSNTQVESPDENPHSEPSQPAKSTNGFVSFSVIKVNTDEKTIPDYRVQLANDLAQLIASKNLSLVILFGKFQVQPLSINQVADRYVPITTWLWSNNKRVRVYSNGIGLKGVQFYCALTGQSGNQFHHYHECFEQNNITCTVCNDANHSNRWIRRAVVTIQSQYGMVLGWEGIANGC